MPEYILNMKKVNTKGGHQKLKKMMLIIISVIIIIIVVVVVMNVRSCTFKTEKDDGDTETTIEATTN